MTRDATMQTLLQRSGADVPPPGERADAAVELCLEDLATLARDGDEAAFSTLYAACAPPVYRYCYARTRNAADAEDLLQQTFLRLVEALPRYEDRGVPFRAWLFRICRTVTIDAHRRRRMPLPLDEHEASAGPAGPNDGDVSRLLAEVLDALERLTGDQRMVIELRFFGDLSARDAGIAMGRDEAAVRALQARAIAALRRHLGVVRTAAFTGAATA